METEHRQQRLGILALCAIVLLVYARGLNGPFLYDDAAYVVHNPTIQSPITAIETFGAPTAIDKGEFYWQVYRPIVPVVYSLIHALFGLNPFGFHLVNVLLHALNAILLFLLLRKLNLTLLAALFSAAWWALHPVHVESVQWISGLDDVLGPTLALAAILLTFNKKYVHALLCYTLALLTKETAIMAIVPLFALEWFRHPGVVGQKLRRASLVTLPFVAPAAAYVLLRFVLIGLQQDATYWGGSLQSTALTMSKAFLVYVRLIFVPVQLRINYLFPVETGVSLAVALGLAALALCLAVIIYTYKKAPLICAGLVWFFAFLFPVSNLLPIFALVGERFMYLPLAGLALVLADLGSRIRNVKKPMLVAGVLILATLAALSVIRIGVWCDEERFWQDIVRKEPEILGYKTNLAVFYAKQQKYDLAEPLFREVFEKRPKDIEAAANLARLFLDSGQTRQAVVLYEQLCAHRPDNPRFSEGLAQAKSALPSPP